MYYLWKGSGHEPAIRKESIPGAGHQAPKTQTIAWKHTAVSFDCFKPGKLRVEEAKMRNPPFSQHPQLEVPLSNTLSPPTRERSSSAVDGRRLVGFPRCDAAT